MDYVRIGLILRPQGVQGELKVQLLSESPDRFENLEEVFLENRGAYSRYGVKSSCIRQDSAYIMLEGVADRNIAESLRGHYLCVKREDAIALPEGRYFIFDLIGCKVEDSNGRHLGILREVLQHGSADVYVIKPESKSCSGLMVPALKRLLKSVDVGNKLIVLDCDVLQEVAVWDED